MRTLRCLIPVVCYAISAQAATLGKVVPLVGGAADLVLDEVRNRVYLLSSTQNLVQIYSIQQQGFLSSVPTDSTPLAAALSRDGKSLYVACYNSSVLDVIDLTALVVSTRVTLPAKPEALAVGADSRVLIGTTGSGTTGASNVLLLYDPNALTLTSISQTPPAPAAPTFPPPSSRPFLSVHSKLRANRSGSYIAGVNAPATGSASAFLYEAASDTVLRSRAIAGSSTTLAISDDGTRLMSGVNLFDATTLLVLAQQNLSNAPYPITPGTSFTAAGIQGGSVFAPGGATLYSAYNVAPVQIPAATSTISQLMLNDPDNLLIEMGIQLPENLAGDMVISSDGISIYALSDSGFVILPVGTISQSPLAVPSSMVALLTRDPCGATAATSTATITINNPGKGAASVTAQLLQYTGVANQASPATAPSVRAGSGSQLVFTYNPAAPQGTGTVTPPHDFLIQSTQAINIPNRVRVYENNRDADARGTIVPISVSIATAPSLSDLVYDPTRQRIYIANTGLNRIEIYDIQQGALLSPVKVGQLPVSIALTPEGDTLYVANSGGESISIVDPSMMQTIGTVSYPTVAFNSTLAMITPGVIAAGLGGPQMVMSDGSLWQIVGNQALPRGVSTLLGATATGLPVKMPVPSTMVSTPDGQYILLATNTGLAYVFSATLNDWVAYRQISTTTATGYIGPVAAGPNGQYYVMNGMLLNQALVQQGRAPTGLVSAVAQVGTSSYAIFSPPATAAATAALVAPTVQILNATTGNSTSQANALEGPATQIAASARATFGGPTMAVDSTGTNAYVLTTSGLSIVPLAANTSSARPVPNPGGIVNFGSYKPAVSANGLLSIFGTNLGAEATAPSTPLPVLLGGSCVTLGTVALPLFYTSPTLINAQIPPNQAVGSYSLVIHSVTNQAASTSTPVAVSKYAPAVLTDTTDGQPLLYHADGSYVNKSNPANRDEPLTMYAVGLGPTTGGAVTAGEPSPSSPLAVSGTVAVFFGNPLFRQAAIIVDWSGLAPELIGVYQLNLRVPGFHISGDALPITLEIGGASSPASGPVVPYVAVN